MQRQAHLNTIFHAHTIISRRSSVVYGRRGPTWEGAVSDIYEVMDPWSEIVETGATPPVDICEGYLP
jgi:hypothetical protein